MLNQDEVEFTVEHLYINKNSKCAALYILATCKNKFVLYTGRLEIKFSRQLEDTNERITCGAFSKLSDFLMIGTSSGKILSYRISDGELDGMPHQAGEVDVGITQMVSLINIEDNEAFLTTIGGKELSIYIHNKKDIREVDYGEDGQVYAGNEICNVQVALNNKFFMIGIPAKRAIGFFGLNRVQLSTKPLKWVTRVSISQFRISSSSFLFFLLVSI